MKKKVCSDQEKLTSKRPITELDTKKDMLHRLVDDIDITDYVEFNSRMVDMSGKSQVIHQIIIEKQGNIVVRPKTRFDHLDED